MRSSTRHVISFLLILYFGVGCYQYSYHRRSPAGKSRVPIDENVPQSKTMFVYFWGLSGGKEYTPDPVRCDNKGAGRVVTEIPPYAPFLWILTLGIVMPAELTIYCNTEEAPGSM